MPRKPPPRRAPALQDKTSRPARWEGKTKPDWLSRALARAGALPLKEAEDAIQEGRVTVNGRVVRQPLAPVPEGAVLRVDGTEVRREVETRVLAFHKPEDLLTSTVSQHRTGTVYEVLLPQLPGELARYTWHAVGRLDRGTTGLLLFTNDEQLVAHATSPETHLAKRYVATVQGTADEARVEPLRRGVQLEDGPTRPAQVQVRDAHTVEVIVTEGRNHQVKRMLGAVGLPVRALHREAIGGVVLDVPVGTFRLLTPEEVTEGLGYAGRHHG
ncbi:pseudouridine synthase [Stigmatella sp. ncwal1]|uniref:Pseudouridine synthase n=1 Tax=Stigmatella ashevillensis TaxID=2995309 RepID=A0ABT5DNE9_9BACT|nr:pseudouridine synthase [Stigmatella ashevillena]MDC0714673.1 pseudouridine synthase [Stigmatella ashevillena]